jgi:riboflavin kinase/FMN adenylyltransferase
VERKLQLEVHLLDFQGDLYGTELTVRFHTFVREEIAFDSKEELIQQIKKDGETVRNYFFIHSK